MQRCGYAQAAINRGSLLLGRVDPGERAANTAVSVRELVLATLARLVHAAATSRGGPQQSQQAVKLLPAKRRGQPVGSPETLRFVVRQPKETA